MPLAFEPTSKRKKGYPSETNVKRGYRIVHGNKELLEKLGRNDPCPCGSLRKFKKCCMKSGNYDGVLRHYFFVISPGEYLSGLYAKANVTILTTGFGHLRAQTSIFCRYLSYFLPSMMYKKTIIILTVFCLTHIAKSEDIEPTNTSHVSRSNFYQCKFKSDCIVIDNSYWHCARPDIQQPYFAISKTSKNEFISSHKQLTSLLSTIPTERLCKSYWDESIHCKDQANNLLDCINSKCVFSKRLDNVCFKNR